MTYLNAFYKAPHMEAHWMAVGTAQFAVFTHWENRRYKNFPELGYPKKTIHEVLNIMEVLFW